ncbi:hypothetical protein M0R45_003361 [Rubus argutus]|uniref:Uncharacterized protein n=1 Tax=Rubus argutus TaxID=59490 RepID=A0AAW1YG87_RUBAR
MASSPSSEAVPQRRMQTIPNVAALLELAAEAEVGCSDKLRQKLKMHESEIRVVTRCRGSSWSAKGAVDGSAGPSTTPDEDGVLEQNLEQKTTTSCSNLYRTVSAPSVHYLNASSASAATNTTPTSFGASSSSTATSNSAAILDEVEMSLDEEERSLDEEERSLDEEEES